MGRRKEKDEIREMIRQRPEYRDGHLGEDRVEELAEHFYAEQDEIFDEYLKAEIRQRLIAMVARGEAEYDPETDRYRLSGGKDDTVPDRTAEEP